jgi:hypothetical protein
VVIQLYENTKSLVIIPYLEDFLIIVESLTQYVSGESITEFLMIREQWEVYLTAEHPPEVYSPGKII